MSSGSASKKTLQRRSHQISQARMVVSSGDTSSQLQAEVKLLTLLGEMGLPVVIPTDHTLAIKADFTLLCGY